MSDVPKLDVARGLMASEVEAVWPIILEVRDAVKKMQSEAGLGLSMSMGLGGSILLNRYMYEVCPDSEYMDTAEAHLDAALEQVGRAPVGSFYGGTVGVAWLLAHLARMDGEEPEVGDLDELVSELLDQNWFGNYDIVSGVVGIGFYALERLPSAVGRSMLAQVVGQLASMAQDVEGTSASWYTRPKLVPPTLSKSHPKGYFNLGMAHGAPGCVRLLAEAIRNDVETNVAMDLLDRSVPWILSHLRQQSDRWVLPSFGRTPEREIDDPATSRLAWCYNELGAMPAILEAGRVLGRNHWCELAIGVLKSTFGADPEAVGCRDASLCHGTAGVAHIYRRMGDTLDDEALSVEAQRWFALTMRLHRTGTGCGGYSYFSAMAGMRNQEWKPEPGFLEGAAGVALALLAGTFDIDTSWDRLLGLT